MIQEQFADYVDFYVNMTSKTSTKFYMILKYYNVVSIHERNYDLMKMKFLLI